MSSKPSRRIGSSTSECQATRSMEGKLSCHDEVHCPMIVLVDDAGLLRPVYPRVHGRLAVLG